MEAQCFTCGATHATEEFRYVTDDRASGSKYYSCNTDCLLKLAQSEREFNQGEDDPKSGG